MDTSAGSADPVSTRHSASTVHPDRLTPCPPGTLAGSAEPTNPLPVAATVAEQRPNYREGNSRMLWEDIKTFHVAVWSIIAGMAVGLALAMYAPLWMIGLIL